ncbi:alpha-galactosidase [Catenulispora subtropica]|uniref:Alpha-glucosidase/alpha-galactosidase n=1 Tax=Catenulispora subtropica TaxID=450798 RepID=A0ABN2T2H6_9ACTN
MTTQRREAAPQRAVAGDGRATRIVLLGAGSMEFSRTLLADLLTSPVLRDSHLVLHDIDPDRLATAAALAAATAEATGAHPTISAVDDRRKALAGADFVVNQIAVGGFDALRLDFEIPRKYGVRQTIGDSLGLGGIFRGLRTIPVVRALGEEMAELCPDAWLLNYTNPMTVVPWAVYAGSPFERVVGLCYSIRDTQLNLAGLVGIPEDEITFLTAGVNHQAWVLRFEKDGVDLYPRLRQVIEDRPEIGNLVRIELFRHLGYFPTESSDHGSEYVPWFLPHEAMVQRHGIDVDLYLRQSRESLQEYDDLRRRLAGGEPVDVDPVEETAAVAMAAIVSGVPATVPGSVPNRGLIDNLPAEACVEVPCLVDGDGFHPRPVGALPPQLAALNRQFLNVSELTVLAGLEGSREHVYHAAMLDPNTAATLTLDAIVAACDELIEAHAAWLPPGITRRR